MENRVTFDYSKAMQFIGENEITSIKAIAETAKNILVEKSGAGNDFLGWIDLPVNYDKEEFARIQKAADKIKNDSDVLIWEPELPSSSCVIAFIITFRKRFGKRRRFITAETASAAPISSI